LAWRFLVQNVAVQRGFLDPPAATDLNGRNLSALYEIVDSRERNPQLLGRLFYGKQIVYWSFAHSLGEIPFYIIWTIISIIRIGFICQLKTRFGKSVLSFGRENRDRHLVTPYRRSNANARAWSI
jgi:hypothetical protein